ncbi:hypothetical protein ET445_06160 [Agromyces protaetiae]|uniref:Large exoprotein n=1 Tax=Agromyces protaetiae TaxID=2509455 RepID=A0A4P6FR30_9MICO|nr:DUF5684 domain-containing protein [Agromyces protaetiae]QAY72988.1 hypothetical protein ET445_06160 [Agromyces protaetiae]
MDFDPTPYLVWIFVGYGVMFAGAIGMYVLSGLSLSRIFQKTGNEGWPAWVPVYNTFQMLKIVGLPGWIAFLIFVPFGSFVVLVYTIMAIHRFSRGFGKGTGFTVLGALLGLVWQVILAFGDTPKWNPALALPAGAGGGSDFAAAVGYGAGAYAPAGYPAVPPAVGGYAPAYPAPAAPQAVVPDVPVAPVAPAVPVAPVFAAPAPAAVAPQFAAPAAPQYAAPAPAAPEYAAPPAPPYAQPAPQYAAPVPPAPQPVQAPAAEPSPYPGYILVDGRWVADPNYRG